jgi:GT2 family glycosyltransferase
LTEERELAQSPRVTAVVLNWERSRETKQCVNSLLQSGYPNLQIILVDNASKDDSLTELRYEFPQLSIIQNSTNFGFAKGCNIGIRKALSDPDCEFVLLLNNDATLVANRLQAAVAIGKNDSEIGIVTGKVLLSRSPYTIWYAGGRIDYWRGHAVVRGFGEPDRGQYDIAGETGFVTGALMLIKRAVLMRVGLLSERYFFGVEDWDFSERVTRAGFKLYYLPSFLGHHLADGSHWNYDPKFVYNTYRNKLIFQEDYLPRLVFPVWKEAFAFYGKYFARRARQRLFNKNLFSLPQPVEFDQLDYALTRAIEDHGKNELSEAVLNSFETELQNRFHPKIASAN